MYNYNIPRLMSYKAAVAHEANVVPIRGRSKECKPLGKRSIWWYRIAKREVGKRTYIDIMHGDTTFATYNPDNTVSLTTDMYWSVSTQVVLAYMMGVRIKARDGAIWILHTGTQQWHRLGERKSWRRKPDYKSRPRLVMCRSEGTYGGYIPKRDLPAPTRTVRDGKKLRALRKEAKPFLAHVARMFALAELSEEELQARGLVFMKTNEDLKTYLIDVSGFEVIGYGDVEAANPNAFPESFCNLVVRAFKHDHTMWHWRRAKVISLRIVLNYFNELLNIRHTKELFSVVPTTAKSPFYDRYKKYLK